MASPELDQRLHECLLALGPLDEVNRWYWARRHSIEAELVATFPHRTSTKQPRRFGTTDQAVSGYERGTEFRISLRSAMDALTFETGPDRLKRQEVQSELSHIERLIQAEKERAAARRARVQTEMFDAD
jgi:hypothetical protein